VLRIYLAGVLSWFASRAHEAVVEAEVLSEPGLAERLQTLLARHGGHLDLLEDHLVLALLAEHVLAPAAGEAAAAVELLVLLGQTDDVHVVRRVHRRVQPQQRHIVVERARVVLGVDHRLHHGAVLVRQQLVLRLRVPLAGADLQTLDFFSAKPMVFFFNFTTR
jgi:hypothetical protein